MTTYPIGAFFVTHVGGRGGFLIGVGQALAGAPSRYEHAGIIIATDGTTVEAQPGGAVLGNMSNHQGHGVIVCDGPVQQEAARTKSFAHPVPEGAVRAAVAITARKLLGTPYSAMDYAALAALHLHLPSTWIRQRVKSSGHMICSQLVDAAYERAGIHLFDDGRWPGDVMPADLAAWAEDYAAGAR